MDSQGNCDAEGMRHTHKQVIVSVWRKSHESSVLSENTEKQEVTLEPEASKPVFNVEIVCLSILFF